MINHGPFSGVAFSSPFAAACLAAKALAESGSPSTSSAVVSFKLNALVLSKTLLLNLEDSSAASN